MFEEVMEWKHGREFACVAFQNRVAHAMNGATLHSDGEVKVGQQNYAAMLECKDVDNIYTKNESKRWLVVDEVFMIPDELLSDYERNYQQAARQGSSNPFFQHSTGERRLFGGMNTMMFGDVNQLPPIPSSAALFIPPSGKKRTVGRTEVLDMFWSDNADSLNFFTELRTQQRTLDPWYSCFLNECREGALTDEQYNFLMGFPLKHSGC